MTHVFHYAILSIQIGFLVEGIVLMAFDNDYGNTSHNF